ncbi:DUF1453 domain-containing protein [Streptomyces monticola]|uniref:DUF1453 domain-containing protein n=1 Tax=Streptomyces monticola TaxID=2666263 RepID=A0ABW2JAZ1_9ACTN
MQEFLILAAVLAVVLVQQFRPQKVATDRRHGWLLPAALVLVSLRGPGLVDGEQAALSAVLLAAVLAAGIGTGVLWAWTSRTWTDSEGVIRVQGGVRSAVVWAGGLAAQLALYGVALPTGVQQSGAAAVPALAAVLLARTAVLTWRTQGTVSVKGAVGELLKAHGVRHGVSAK